MGDITPDDLPDEYQGLSDEDEFLDMHEFVNDTVSWEYADENDPDEGANLHFDETNATIDWVHLSDSVLDRQTALQTGVPASILDLFEGDCQESDIKRYGYGFMLMDWLGDILPSGI